MRDESNRVLLNGFRSLCAGRPESPPSNPTSSPFQSPREDSDHFFFGDPHIHYAEGTAEFDDVKLYLPDDG